MQEKKKNRLTISSVPSALYSSEQITRDDSINTEIFSSSVKCRQSDRPLLAFVIITWNSANYIIPCIDSVLALKGFDILACVIDNGSTDGTGEIIRQYEKDDSRIIFISLEKNYGTTVSRNIALKAIPDCVDYICILDSDTVINEKALIELSDHLKNDSSIGIIGPEMVDSSGKVQLSGRNFPTPGCKFLKVLPFSCAQRLGEKMEKPCTPVFDGLQEVGYLLSACWLMPRWLINKIGFLDEGIFYAPEDAEYCARAHEAGLRVVFCPGAQIIHEYQRISRKKLISKSNVEHIRGLVRFFAKYGVRGEARLSKEGL